jgi:hypothetical protein
MYPRRKRRDKFKSVKVEKILKFAGYPIHGDNSSQPPEITFFAATTTDVTR